MRLIFLLLFMAQLALSQGMINLSAGKAFTSFFSNAETIFVNPASLASVKRELAFAASLKQEIDMPAKAFFSAGLSVGRHSGIGLSFNRSSVVLLQPFSLVQDQGDGSVFFTRTFFLEEDQKVLGRKFPTLEREVFSAGFGMEVPSKLDIPLFWGFRVRQVKMSLTALASAGEFGLDKDVSFKSSFSTFALDTGLEAHLDIQFFKEKFRKRVAFGLILKNFNEPSAFSQAAIRELFLPPELFRLDRAWQLGAVVEWNKGFSLGGSFYATKRDQAFRFGIIKENIKFREKGASYTLALGMDEDNFSFGLQRESRRVKLAYTVFQHQSQIHQRKFLHHLFSLTYIP